MTQSKASVMHLWFARTSNEASPGRAALAQLFGDASSPLALYKGLAHGRIVVHSLGELPELAYGELPSMDAALSDLVRFIVLRKYGGIYTDLDNIFIKEMSPLCGSSFFYYWSDSDAQSPSDSNLNVALANTAVMGCALGCDFVEH